MRARIVLLIFVAILVTSCRSVTPVPTETAEPAPTDTVVSGRDESVDPAPTDTVAPAPTVTEGVASPTTGATASPTAGTVGGAEAGAGATPTTSPSEAPTLTPPAIDLGQLSVEGELQVDGTNGRLYVRARYQDEPYTAAFDAASGQVLALYPESGRLAPDPIRRWLIVDRGNDGLVIRDVAADTIVQEIMLPGTVPQGGRPAAPVVMETTGDILAFRNSTVYRVEPISGMVEHLVTFEEPVDVCGQPGNPASISDGWWDDRQQILYLSFVSYVCTPWSGFTLRSYDLESGQVLAEEAGLAPFTAVATEQGLVLRVFPRLGPAYFQRWQANGGGVTGDQERHYGAGPLAYDPQRAGVYAVTGREMQLVDRMDLEVRGRATRDQLGLATTDRLLGYDSVSDHLYFRDDRYRLRLLDGATVRAVLDTPVAPPAGAIRSGTLHASAGADGISLVGVWTDPECDAPGVVFSGETSTGPWRNMSINGTGDLCDGVATLAQTTGDGGQRYFFALRAGTSSIFTSFDNGLTWSPGIIDTPAPFDQLLPSPGYSGDLTLFGWSAGRRTLYRTDTGGNEWREIRTGAGPAVLSHEFAADGTVATFGGGIVYISGDAGETWAETAPLPDGEQVAAVSLAPLWNRWGVLFAYTESGALYRSLDRGASWAFMARAGGGQAQFAYGPTEAQREVFLLVDDGLHRSGDGGATWTYVGYPEATAMTISPNFAADHTLYLGTEDGDVLTADTASP